MEDAEDLAGFFEALGVPALYQDDYVPDVALSVIRQQGTATVRQGGMDVLMDTEVALIQVADVPVPRPGAWLTFTGGDERFKLRGGARLDRSGTVWACPLQPA